jgi:hypothetical protein
VPTTEPTVRIARYVVSCFPPDFEDASTWDLVVEERGGLWAVSNGGVCLDRGGKEEYEPSPSNRDESFLARFRFPLEEALEIAKCCAPNLRKAGLTPAEVIERFGPQA